MDAMINNKNMFHVLLKEMKEKGIDDIFSVGFIDKENGIYQFYPIYDSLFIQVLSYYIKLTNDPITLRFVIGIVDRIDFQFEIEDDMFYSISSIEDQVLDDIWAAGNNIKEINLFDFDENNYTCLAIEVTLFNGQKIFFDPSYEFGIKIGGDRLKQLWIDNTSDSSDKKVKRII